MSDDYANKSEPVKRRRLQGACDSCRKRKIRCDSSEMPGYDCTHCLTANIECTHTEPVKKRGPKTGYVDQLERRANRMEELLRQFVPDLDLSQELATTDIILPNPAAHHHRRPPPPRSSPGAPSSESTPPLVSSADSPFSPEGSEFAEEEDLAYVGLAEHLKKLDLAAMDRRFFGPSSAFMLAKNAMVIKDKLIGHAPEKYSKRPRFWNMHPWEAVGANRETPFYQFPDIGLQQSLIDLFFANINPFYPLFHRPTFDLAVKSGLHRRDPRFGAVLLLVFAISSRFSNDARVFEDGEELGAGWKFFEQVQLMRKSLFNVPSVHDLQIYSLSAMYYLSTSMPQAAWTACGIGLRFAEELGTHRRKPDNYQMTADDELKRRAFFILLAQDRILSTFLGRSYGMHEEDYDVSFPADCDDQYWDEVNPELRFKQPPGRPSMISFFISYLQLLEILAVAVKSLYATKKSKLLLGMSGEEWEHKIVAQLDSQLGVWMDSIPVHLRWDPKRADRISKKQSQILYITYYHTQIQIHRPFITKTSALSFSSLAICTNAARALSHVVEGFGPDAIPTPILKPVFNGGVVLLFNLWGRTQSGLPLDSVMEFADIGKIMAFLKSFEERWSVAGRLWDMLNELGSVKDIPVAKPRPNALPKRARSPSSAPQDHYTSPGSSALHSTPSPQGSADTVHWTTLQDALYQDEVNQMPWNLDAYYRTVPITNQPPESGISLPPYAMPPGHGGPPQNGPPPTHVQPPPPPPPLEPDPVPYVAADPTAYNLQNALPPGQENWTNLEAYQEDNVNIWSTAPVGFSMEDWGSYIAKSRGQPEQYSQPDQYSQQLPPTTFLGE